jgi:hypothetical protein
MLIYEKGWTKITNFGDLDAMDDDDWDKVPEYALRGGDFVWLTIKLVLVC